MPLKRVVGVYPSFSSTFRKNNPYAVVFRIVLALSFVDPDLRTMFSVSYLSVTRVFLPIFVEGIIGLQC